MKQKIVNYGKEKRIKILEKSKLLSDEYLKIKDEQQAKTDLLLDAEHLTKHTSTPWCTFKDHDNKYYDLEIEFIAVKKHSASAWCSELVDRYIKWPVDNFFINNYIEPPMYLDHIVAKKFSRLWKSEYRHLDLSGLVELNDSVAEALSSCDSKGSYLYLDGLKEINVKSSEYLLKGNFSTLSLNGLTKMSSDLANSLSGFSNLYLDGLSSLSVSSAMALKGNQHELSLDGIKHINSSVAQVLASYEVDTLYLNGLSELTPDLINAICKANSTNIDLRGIKHISVSAAESLNNTKGYIDLSGVDHFEEGAATILEPLWKKQIRFNRKFLASTDF